MSGPNLWNLQVRMSGKVKRVMLEVIADLNSRYILSALRRFLPDSPRSRNNLSSTSINWRKLPREAGELAKGDDRPIQQIVLEDAMSEIVEDDGSWSGSVRSLKEVIIDKLDDIMVRLSKRT